jgi:hypothetical protein
MQLAHELLPTAISFTLLINPTSPVVKTISREMQLVASTAPRNLAAI